MLPLAFTSPLMLLALGLLPALWILLRLVPPRQSELVKPRSHTHCPMLLKS